MGDLKANMPFTQTIALNFHQGHSVLFVNILYLNFALTGSNYLVIQILVLVKSLPPVAASQLV